MMNELFKQKLAENGADVEGTLSRFAGNEAIYLKFLLKFKADPNFNALKESLDGNNIEEAFKAAHTLKGVSINLGLMPIYESASAMSELLRGKTSPSETDIEQVKEQWNILEERYQLFISLIDENS